MDTSRFYEELPSFDDFIEITGDQYFCDVPQDWIIFITDVRGSTKAIEAGRYKDVNTIGAASICAVKNVHEGDFPYVFGGDGATLLIAPQKFEEVVLALKSLQSLSQTRFGLELRVGYVPVKEIIEQGSKLEVAKHELFKGKCVAVFRGGGLSLAEQKIKSGEKRYECPERPPGKIDLKGLSCRWNAIPNKRGKVLSIIALSREENTTLLYGDFLQFLNSLFDGNMETANPVNTELMNYKSIGECISDEKRYTTNLFSPAYFCRLFEIIAAVLFFKYRSPNPAFETVQYTRAMRLHADHRKFDDMLRMVIDCSPEQVDKIREYLKGHHLKGNLYYGLHESETSLMTCLVQDVKDGNHIHFIDGGNGGYAMAAKQLKKQIKDGGVSCAI